MSKVELFADDAKNDCRDAHQNNDKYEYFSSRSRNEPHVQLTFEIFAVNKYDDEIVRIKGV